MARRLTGWPTVRYRNARWVVSAVRPNWVLIEQGKGLKTHEALWVPKGCLAGDELRLAQDHLRQLDKEGKQ